MKYKRFISFLLVISMLFSLSLVFIGCSDKENKEETDNAEDTPQNTAVGLSPTDFKTEIYSASKYIQLTASPMVAAVNGAYVEQSLTATVLPSTAVNKTVDWSVSWAEEGKTEAVTDYVTVTPTSNGSIVATVTCKKAFSGNIVVTVTTRESGFSAECIVTFVGIPTDITVTTAITEQSNGYHVGIGNAYTFNVGLTNPFGTVGSDYQNLIVELSGVGSMVLGYYEYYVSSGTKNWVDSHNVTVTLDSLKEKFITVNYSDGVITVNTLRNIESYYEKMQRLDAGRTRAYTNAFRNYVDDCYFTVKITEPNTGLSKTLLIRFDATIVSSVSVSSTQLLF